jgi:hypothetical protein
MKRVLIGVMMLAVILSASNVFAQGRLPQFEVYMGAGIPLGPDWFKDYYQVGFSLHAQYVRFVTPNVGLSITGGYEIFTFNQDAATTDLEDAGFTNIDISGKAAIAEFGVGIRPYLTPATANAQIFLFGMGTVNVIKESLEGSYYDPYYDINWTLTDADPETKFGIAAGGGIEMPAGNMNLIFQGVARFIFGYGEDSELDQEGETISFLGVTAGLVF